MFSVCVIMTCYNRKEYTRRCIESLQTSDLEFQFIVTDDNSTDGTDKMLKQLQSRYSITILHGNGSLFWSGGMRKGMAYAKKSEKKFDYYVLVNDDVQFYQDVIIRTIEQSRMEEDAVIAGVTEDSKGDKTYGGIQYEKKGIHYHLVCLGEKCETFNCNFVLVPGKLFQLADNFDTHFTHAMADFDYGLQIRKLGSKIYASSCIVGICEKNKIKGTWQDKSLGIRERIRRKESPKGLPIKEWFYFLRKNFGFKTAVLKSITPYIRIMMRR